MKQMYYEDYRSLKDEIKDLTEHEGFLRAALRLRDDMLFYDRDVLLAVFSGNLEAIIVSAMFWATMEGDQEAAELGAWILGRIEGMPENLWEEDMPFDVQALLERFLETSGQALRRRFPVIASVFGAYLAGEYDLGEDPDGILIAATKKRGLEAAVLGRLGAMALQGKFFRRGWLIVIPPLLQEGLQTIISLVEGVAAMPGLGFPLREIARERGRISGPPVGLVHLDEFRRRKGSTPQGGGVWRAPDEIDRLLAAIFNADKPLEDGEVESVLEKRGELIPLLLNVVISPEFLDDNSPGGGMAPINAANILARAKAGEAADGLIQLLSHADPYSPAYEAALKGLEALADKSGKRIADHLEGEGDMNVAVPLASVLGKSTQDEGIFRALAGLFGRVAWNEDRETVAAALADYGDPRAIPILEEALQRREGDEKGAIIEAISRLRKKGAKPQTGEIKRRLSQKNGYTGEN